MRRAALRWMTMALAAGTMEAVGAGVGAASAQQVVVVPRQPGGVVGVSLITADPAGELGYYFDQGFGAQLNGAFPLEPSGRLRIRGDLGWVIYGYERKRVCFGTPIGCRIEADLTTTNNIFFGGLGPELVLATGTVQPYLNVSWGLSYFATSSSLGGSADLGDFAHTTNFDDATFAWRAGGGVRWEVKGGRKPIYLDVGAEWHQNGLADFLAEGDIIDYPDGSITMTPHRAEANLTTFHFGVAFGIPRGGQEGGRRHGGHGGGW
jgi:hypothetical protein